MTKKVILVSALALGLAMSVGQVANAGTKAATCAQQATKAGIKNKKERANYIKKCKAEQKKAQKMKKNMKKEMKQEKKAKQ